MAIGLMKLYPVEALVAGGMSPGEANAAAGTAMAVFFSLANGAGRGWAIWETFHLPSRSVARHVSLGRSRRSWFSPRIMMRPSIDSPSSAFCTTLTFSKTSQQRSRGEFAL